MMKNPSQTFAASAGQTTIVRSVQVERDVLTHVAGQGNHLDTKFAADEVYSSA
jgi:hypothetical protein